MSAKRETSGFANRLRKELDRRGWTQQDLADATHGEVSIDAVKSWTSKNLPSFDAIVAVCDAFGWSADYLLGRSMEPESRATIRPGSIIIDQDRLNDLLGAKSLADLEDIVDWNPDIFPIDFVMPAHYRIVDHREFARVREKVKRVAVRLRAHDEWAIRMRQRLGDTPPEA